LLTIEGRAIRQDCQGQGLGTLALKQLLANVNVDAVASVTRNPAVPKLMTKVFHIVSPDLSSPDPLHYFKSSRLIQHMTNSYAEHIGAAVEDQPFVCNRYGDGLYGGYDPGREMTCLPQISNNPSNGIIMVAMAQKELT
jgi:hypothetical protein